MTSITINLPEPLKGLMTQRAAQRGYTDPGDYVAALIREDIEGTASDDALYGDLIDEGLDSGPAREMSREDWDALKAEVLRSTDPKDAE